MLHVMKMKLPHSNGGSSCPMSLSSTLTLFGKKRLVFIFRHFLKRLHDPAGKAAPFLS